MKFKLAFQMLNFFSFHARLGKCRFQHLSWVEGLHHCASLLRNSNSVTPFINQAIPVTEYAPMDI